MFLIFDTGSAKPSLLHIPIKMLVFGIGTIDNELGEGLRRNG